MNKGVLGNGPPHKKDLRFSPIIDVVSGSLIYDIPNIKDVDVVRFDSSGGAPGVQGINGGYPGKWLLITNVDKSASSGTIALASSDTGTGAHRFVFANDDGISLKRGMSVWVYWDETEGCWTGTERAPIIQGGSGLVVADGAGAAGTAGSAHAASHGHRMNTDATTPQNVDATAGAAGTSGQAPSRGDHRHTLGSHDNTLHTDRTRHIFIPANTIQNDDGTVTSTGTTPDLISARVMADAAATGSYFTFAVPDDWVSATALNAVIFWTTPTTVATSAVKWRLQRLELIVGTTDVTTAMTTTDFTGTSQTHTNGILYSDTQASWFTPTTAGNLIKAGVRRLGGDAADTLTANARIHGLRIEYTANA